MNVQGDEATPICGFGKIQCLIDSVKSIMGEKIKNFTTGSEDVCNCLPACAQISYGYEISQANLNFINYMKSTVVNQSTEINLK